MKGTTDESVINPIRAALINWEYEPAQSKRRSPTLAHVPILRRMTRTAFPAGAIQSWRPFWHIPESAMDKLINNGGTVQIASAEGVSWSIERLRARSQSP